MTEAQFDSLLDFVDEVVEGEPVKHSKGGVQNIHMRRLRNVRELYLRRLVVLGVQRVGEWSKMIVLAHVICLQAL
jgi:hypothetical protein